MKPGEMPEFKHPSVRVEKEDWGCLHCWTNNATSYADMSWASVKLHLQEKCVTCSNGVRLDVELKFPEHRHDVDKPTENDYYCARPTIQSDFFYREATTM